MTPTLIILVWHGLPKSKHRTTGPPATSATIRPAVFRSPAACHLLANPDEATVEFLRVRPPTRRRGTRLPPGGYSPSRLAGEERLNTAVIAGTRGRRGINPAMARATPRPWFGWTMVRVGQSTTPGETS